MYRASFAAALLAAGLAALPATTLAAESCDGVGAELATMVQADQAIRNRIDLLDQLSAPQQKLAGYMTLVDRTNTARLKTIVARCGWPAREKHGKQAEDDAWLLAQHADRDLAFQKRALALIEEAILARGDSVDRNFAYLHDRVAVAEGRPQRYGTQLYSPSGKACSLEFRPLDKREQVDARRAQLNLPPLESYRKMVLDLQHCPAAGSDDYHYAPPGV